MLYANLIFVYFFLLIYKENHAYVLSVEFLLIFPFYITILFSK